MGKTFIFDAAKCNGCRNCQLACKDEHVDNEWLPYSKPQPDTGQFWTRIEERIRGQVPKVKIAYIMHMCQHCDGAPYMVESGSFKTVDEAASLLGVVLPQLKRWRER